MRRRILCGGHCCSVVQKGDGLVGYGAGVQRETGCGVVRLDFGGDEVRNATIEVSLVSRVMSFNLSLVDFFWERCYQSVMFKGGVGNQRCREASGHTRRE